jgi:hypothetical protein
MRYFLSLVLSALLFSSAVFADDLEVGVNAFMNNTIGVISLSKANSPLFFKAGYGGVISNGARQQTLMVGVGWDNVKSTDIRTYMMGAGGVQTTSGISETFLSFIVGGRKRIANNVTLDVFFAPVSIIGSAISIFGTPISVGITTEL